MRVDMTGFREKVLRRTDNQNTVDVCERGVAKLAQFGRVRLGLEGSDERVLQTIVNDLAENPDSAYTALDKFMGWTLTLKDHKRRTDHAVHSPQTHGRGPYAQL
jgi:hypothetical protein